MPVVTVEMVNVEVWPCVTVPSEGEAEGGTRAGFTVAVAAVDRVEAQPKLSVTFTVMELAPVVLGVKGMEEGLPVWANCPLMYHW